MAQSGYTPIQLYHSTTSGLVPVAGNLIAGELAINTADGKLYYKNSAGVVSIVADGENHTTWDSANSTLIVDATGALQVAVGTNGQRPSTPSVGDVRYNTTTPGFEGYQTISGVPINSITNVTTTATATTNLPHNLTSGDTIVMTGCTPAAYNGTYVVTVTGAATFEYTMLTDPGSSATVIGSFIYNGWGAIGSGTATLTGGPIIENDQFIAVDYTMGATRNGESVGPITVNSGVIVTIPTGSRWVIL